MPPPPPTHRRSWLLIFAAAALLLLFLRRPDAFLRPQFWAEDFLFLVEAESRGGGALFAPYAGYLHLLPRLVAWPAAQLDPVLQPGVFLLGWLTVFFTVLGWCFSPRHDLPCKWGLALALILVPHTGEVFFNPVNIQWVAALGLVLIAVKRDPATWQEWMADLGGLTLAGLSGPFAIFALPIFLHRAWQRRSRAAVVLAAVTLLAASTQVWQVLHASPAPEFVGPYGGTANLAAVVAFRIPGSLFLGAWLPAAVGKAAMIATGALLTGFLGYAAWRCPAQRTHLAYAWVFAAAVVMASARWRRFDLWSFGDAANGDRYFFIPKVILLWVTCIVAASAPVRWLRHAGVLLLLGSVLANRGRYKFEPYTDHHWYEQAADIRAGKEVMVTVNPGMDFRYRRAAR